MENERNFRRIGVPDALRLLECGEALLLDTRERAAYERGRIADALHLSDANAGALVATTPRQRPILIYCYHGNASQVRAQMFADFGFREVYSLDGGYEAWCATQAAPAGKPDEALARWLSEHGFAPGKVDVAGSDGLTPLMRASRLGQADIVSALLAAGASLAARNADGNQALWFACVGAHLELLDSLIAAGADLDNQNDNGATCLMYAASTGKAEVVQRLLAAGADPTLATLDDFTALDMAATLDCLRLLRPAGKRCAPAQA